VGYLLGRLQAAGAAEQAAALASNCQGPGMSGLFPGQQGRR
jgi:hypothetical protein